MEIRYATISKTGRRRNNEDAYKVIDMPQNNRFMGIVCDGMVLLNSPTNSSMLVASNLALKRLESILKKTA